MPSSRGSDQRSNLCLFTSPVLAVRFITTSAAWEAQVNVLRCIKCFWCSFHLGSNPSHSEQVQVCKCQSSQDTTPKRAELLALSDLTSSYLQTINRSSYGLQPLCVSSHWPSIWVIRAFVPAVTSALTALLPYKCLACMFLFKCYLQEKPALTVLSKTTPHHLTCLYSFVLLYFSSQTLSLLGLLCNY